MKGAKIMKRVQCYPDEALWTRLTQDAERAGVSVSTWVTELLRAHYGLGGERDCPEPELMRKVFQEVEAYLQEAEGEFDLLQASETFGRIEMTLEGRPNPMRAKVGKRFAAQVGKPGPFQDVEQVYVNGRVKKSVNKAALYRRKPESAPEQTEEAVCAAE